MNINWRFRWFLEFLLLGMCINLLVYTSNNFGFDYDPDYHDDQHEDGATNIAENVMTAMDTKKIYVKGKLPYYFQSYIYNINNKHPTIILLTYRTKCLLNYNFQCRVKRRRRLQYEGNIGRQRNDILSC